jgi:hypothetical protein
MRNRQENESLPSGGLIHHKDTKGTKEKQETGKSPFAFSSFLLCVLCAFVVD